GTVKGRLARGRNMLRDRLQRRGVALSIALLGAMLKNNAATAAVPTALLTSTRQAALMCATGTATSSFSTTVTLLADQVLHTTRVSKLKFVPVLCVALAVLGSGIGLVAHFHNKADADKSGDETAIVLPADPETVVVSLDLPGRGEGKDPYLTIR